LIRLTMAFGTVVAIGGYAQSFDWALTWWERLAPLRSIQAPYRLLGPAAYGTALVAGGLVALLARTGSVSARAAPTPPTPWAWLATAVAMVALAVSSTAGRTVPQGSDVSRTVDSRFAIERQRTHPGDTASTEEFLPRTADYAVWHQGEARGFWLYERLFPEASWTAGRLMVWHGEAAVHTVQGGALWTTARITVPGEAGAVLAFHQLAFPGWRAWIDGRPAALEPAPWIEAQAIRPGFLLLSVPPGSHEVTIRFGPDGTRLGGSIISLAALLAIAGWLLWRGGRPWRLLGAGLLAVAVVAGALTVAPLRPRLLRPPATDGVAHNLIDAVAAGQATLSSPSGAALGPDRYLDVRYLGLQAHDPPLRDAGPRTRRWLFMHAPAEATVELDLPPEAYFQTSLALDPAAWDAPLGDGVRFLATVTPLAPHAGSQGTAATILDLVVHPRGQGEQRRWLDVVADLRPWAGQRVRLTLRTDPRQDPTFDWSGWGEPAVVRLDPITAGRLLAVARSG
jgi:hypothetical protein